MDYLLYLLPSFNSARNRFRVMKLNPMYHYINYFRDLILYGRFPGLKENFLCALISLISLTIGITVFYRNRTSLYYLFEVEIMSKMVEVDSISMMFNLHSNV